MEAITRAWEAGFAQYQEKFPDALRIVAREMAWEQFVKDCQGKETHPLFVTEAPKQAYLLLCIEHLKHNRYAR